VRAGRSSSPVGQEGRSERLRPWPRSQPSLRELARHFAADLGLTQVEVREGDAYDTGLPRPPFDGAHMRLVLVNVPKPELIVREMVSLVRPGGWVASFEADVEAMVLDPPSAEYVRLRRAYIENVRTQGIDLFVGRRTHRLFRGARLVDIAVDVAIQPHSPGPSRRPIFRDFVVNVQEQLVAGGFISAEDLERDLAAYERQLADPHVVATSCLYFRLRGWVPA
jgi:SAM-dependent methyltransferase